MPVIKRWESDNEFKKIYRSVQGRTLLDRDRLYILYQLARHVDRVKGDIAEIGVFKGGSAKVLKTVLNDRRLFLFDTFEGMPEIDPSIDKHRKGQYYQTTVESVLEFIGASFRIHIYKGTFPHTVDRNCSGPFAFVHADADIYTSTMNVCKYFVPRLSPGGMILFDDYGGVMCPGARKAVDEYFSSMGRDVIYLPTGQALYIE